MQSNFSDELGQNILDYLSERSAQGTFSGCRMKELKEKFPGFRHTQHLDVVKELEDRGFLKRVTTTKNIRLYSLSNEALAAPKPLVVDKPISLYWRQLKTRQIAI